MRLSIVIFYKVDAMHVWLYVWYVIKSSVLHFLIQAPHGKLEQEC